ncbi:MAG: adenine-specific methyltransferase EcoRI family protein [Phycisphaerales bacterium]
MAKAAKKRASGKPKGGTEGAAQAAKPASGKAANGKPPRPPSTPQPLNRSLHAAKATKQDEFYTQLSDIEKELKHYSTPQRNHFKGKTVLCNCDDPKVSNFFHFFAHNFHKLGLKRLITTCYKNADPDIFSKHEGKRGLRLIYNGEQTPGGRIPALSKLDALPLEEDGDFRSAECLDLLKQADIVVTNPPFSLFREYIAQLVEHRKKFLVIGNQNAITYKDVFTLIQENRLWLGASIHSGDREFGVPDHYPLNAAGTRVDVDGNKFIRVKGVRWFTNLDYDERHDDLPLYAPYSRAKYPRYANYDAIEVGKTADIPVDYDGAMGVPITFLDKYNPDQFEIMGSSRALGRPMSEVAKKGTFMQGGPRFYLANGDGTYRRMYDRLVIRKK